MGKYTIATSERDEQYHKAINDRKLEIEKINTELPELEAKLEAETNASSELKVTLTEKMLTDAEMKQQMAVYTTKFETFQSTLSSSNEMYQKFEENQALLGKVIKKMRAENKKLNGN